MTWLADYHALLRTALWLKTRVGRGTAEEALAEAASAFGGMSIDAELVRGVADPPGGRLVTLVFDTLERIHGSPAATIRRTLFPRSKR